MSEVSFNLSSDCQSQITPAIQKNRAMMWQNDWNIETIETLKSG